MISSLSSIKKNKQLKRWSTIFTEKVDEIKERKQKHDEAVDTMEIMTSKVAIVDMMDFSITTSYRNKLERHGKQHIDNLPAPPRQMPWDPSLGMQLLCDLCNTPALNNSIICKKCNIVCHTHCVVKIKSTGRKLFQGHVSLDEWQCPHCEESLVADLTYYNRMVTKLRDEKMRNLCANMIIKRMMIFLERKKLARKMKAVVQLQAAFRRKLVHTKFMAWKKNILRLIILEITALPSKLLTENYSTNGACPMIVVTVHDTFKNIQLFRFDRTIPETFSDALFIPGITSHMSVFITIAMKEEIYNYSMIAQCQLALRDIVQIDVTKPFILKFNDRISWPPQDIKNAVFTYHLNPMPANSPYKDYFKTNHSSSSCGGAAGSATGNAGATVTFAPSTNSSSTTLMNSSGSLSASLAAANAASGPAFLTSGISSGMSVASGSVVTSATALTGGTGAASATSNGNGGGPPSPTPAVNPNAPVGLSLPPTAAAPNNSCMVNYLPQNNTSSLCRMIQGPPLDILRRPADSSKKPGQVIQKNKQAAPGTNNNQPNNYRNSRYWICLYKLRLMFFQYYGDIVPRFIADISDVVAKVERDKGRTTTLVNLIHPDGRVWLLEFQTKQDACKFEFAVNESRKAKNEAKGSKFLVSNEFFTPEISFGFHIVRERE